MDRRDQYALVMDRRDQYALAAAGFARLAEGRLSERGEQGLWRVVLWLHWHWVGGPGGPLLPSVEDEPAVVAFRRELREGPAR